MPEPAADNWLRSLLLNSTPQSAERKRRRDTELAKLPQTVASAYAKFGKAEEATSAATAWSFHDNATPEATPWLIKNILPHTGAGLISGQWGSYKTTVALDIAVSVMTAMPFAGRFGIKRSGGVAYFAPEGGGGLGSRLTAAARARGIRDPLPFVENRPGGGGNIGIEAVVRSPADGYTLLVVGTTAAINATLFEKLNYNFIRDIAPVASIHRVPHVMQVNPSLPVATVPEFIAHAKANPGKISMGSGGNGSPAHVIGELFKMITGVNLTHVPYRSAGPAITDLLGGQIQVTFTDMAASIEYIRAGRLRALAVTTAMRSEALPDIPTVGDFVPGFEASQWVGLSAPKNTASEIINKLNSEINAGLADPKLKTRFADLGGMVLPGSVADFGKLIADDTEKWGKVVKFSGAKPE